ncbi:hypothetical protein [Caballeronia sp. SBC2]|uniref:hypothetical protein n=1 Tax=Caballeronia sp. SBC2 TaxID=2705547 RepID=UPI0013E1300A|nr:hypothetical protein [Caballeronia sp. SBC2]QIE30193.1 hypothetical protein SBC2_82690 [Caballeronia sp. SBC2]
MSLKVLDYGKQHPFGEIFGKTRFLAWPVNAFRVTLPNASGDDDGLNPFERVILKILDVTGTEDARVLADETRIPLDLVKGILLRLRDRGFIDEYGYVASQEPGKGASKDESASVFVTALLFRELVTGKILPFLHLLDDTNPLRKKEDHETVFRLIRWDDVHKKSIPAPRDVISTWRAMKKRSAAVGMADKMPAVKQISVARVPELYFLECPIAIQKSDGEFRIADPFGNGFSLVLESAFEQLLEHDEDATDWLNRWKESLSNPRSPNSGDSDQRSKELFENEANWQRYPKLVASLRPSQHDQFRSIFKIYSSLEWALFYACCQRPFELATGQLRLESQSQHAALLANAAQTIGLEVHKHDFWPIREGKLLDFQDGLAELRTVLAVAILQAQQDESHPLRRIAFSQPGLIRHLLSIKKKRDERAHGKGATSTQEMELSDDPHMREIVHSLLPDISFSDTRVTTQADRDVRADAFFDARASVQSEFSFKVFNRLGPNLQNRLIHAERFWLSCKDVDQDARSFADDLYAAVQSAFEKRLAGKLPPDISDSEFISAAEKNASEAGLGGALPECLSKVKTSSIRQTLQGAGQTLGACAIALLLMSGDDALCSIADFQPSFIDDIANVIVKRKHGNEQLRLPKADVKKLRKASYKTIKTLVEA